MYLTQGLHRSIQRRPETPATIFDGRVRTYGEVADRVARLAGGLRALGVNDDDRVGILALNSDRYAEALLAVSWANGVFQPINVRWTPAEIASCLAETQAKILFVDDAFATRTPIVAGQRPPTAVYLGDGAPPHGMLGHEDLIAESRPVLDVRRGGTSLAGIFYTGGTTGAPRGVMLSHANLLTSLHGVQLADPIALPGGRMLLVGPMFHLATLAPWIAQHLVGGTQVILPSFDPRTVLETIARYDVTSAALVPTLIRMLVDDPSVTAHDLSSLRRLTYGGSPISERVLTRAMAAFPRASFTQIYGLTELAGLATVLDTADHQERRRLRSAGRAAPVAELRVVDTSGADVPRGVVGEVVCRGGHVMVGYWDKPEDTSQTLRDGWLHTGDAGYLDSDGYLYLVDRIKDMIVSGGENVYSTEVEKAISTHPAVSACAVIGLPDSTWGERVHAVVVLRPGHEITADELRDHCRKSIAAYKTPRSCEFVESLPMSGAGKPLKRQLRNERSGLS